MALFEIKNRITGSVIFSLECGSMKLCVEAAVKSGANLSGAYLSDADLSYADLSGAGLSRANLSGANLSGANLSYANLSGAYLSRANLSGANLSGAYLSDANLSDANLSGANLSGANLSGAKEDVMSILSMAPNEVPGLRQALIDGRVDGSVYSGPCCCLIGTIANVRGCHVDEVGIEKNSSRPAERFFMGISKGDTPENNQFSKIALQWVDEFLAGKTEQKAVG